MLDSPHGARFVGEMDRVFDTYGELLPPMQAWVAERFPQQAGDSDFVYRQATRAKSLDALRGLLPAASLSNIGIYGTGQSYEQLLLRMRAHPLPEARLRGHDADELRKVIPSFLQRVDVPDAGRRVVDVPGAHREKTARVVRAPVARLDPGTDRLPARAGQRGEVTLLDFDPDGEEKVLAAAVSPSSACSSARPPGGYGGSATTTGSHCCRPTSATGETDATGPGRAFERTDYRFELVTDYGAFRDLQRHRMLTIEWQRLGVSLGYDMPGSWRTPVWTNVTTRRSHAPRTSTAPSSRTSPSRRLRRRAGASHPLRHAVQRAEAMHLTELRSGRRGIRLPQSGPADASRHRGGRRTPCAGRRHVALSTTVDRPGAARIGAPGRASADGKICNALTRKYPCSPWWRASELLDGPTPELPNVRRSPDAPKDAADEEALKP